MSDLYDEIASVYHLVYEDWEASIARQAEVLDAVVRAQLGAGARTILDVSCGIGTQALGLAALGHRVTAADPSAASVARARAEGAERGLDIAFHESDMRACDGLPGGPFDVVLSADNSVPHLPTDDDIRTAFRAFSAATRPDGLVVVTVRDYAKEDLSPRQLRPYGIRETEGGRTIVFQTWEVEGDHYDVAMYFVEEDRDGACRMIRGRSRYYAISTDRLCTLLAEAGLKDPQRLDTPYFQPVLIARR